MPLRYKICPGWSELFILEIYRRLLYDFYNALKDESQPSDDVKAVRLVFQTKCRENATMAITSSVHLTKPVLSCSNTDDKLISDVVAILSSQL